MITGLACVAAYLAIILITYLVGNKKSYKNYDKEFCKYPDIFLKIILSYIFIWPILGGFIYTTFPLPRPVGYHFLLFVLSVCSVEIFIWVFWLYVKTFSIEFSKENITTRNFFSSKEIDIRCIGFIELIHGARGSRFMRLLGRNRELLIKVSGSILGFDLLYSTVKSATLNQDVILRERTYSGKWRRARNVANPQWISD